MKKQFTFKKYFIKKSIIIILFYCLIVCLGYAISSLGIIAICFFAGIIVIIFSINYIIKYIKFFKNEDRNKLEEEISKCLLKQKGYYFTDKYIFSLSNFEKIYYSDILVVEDKFSYLEYFLYPNGMGPLTRLTLYMKDETQYYIYGNHLWDSFDDIGNIKKIIDLRNPRVYFGKYKDYKKIHKDK